eukprot:6416669-Amphidinium_carterae.1
MSAEVWLTPPGDSEQASGSASRPGWNSQNARVDAEHGDGAAGERGCQSYEWTRFERPVKRAKQEGYGNAPWRQTVTTVTSVPARPPPPPPPARLQGETPPTMCVGTKGMRVCSVPAPPQPVRKQQDVQIVTPSSPCVVISNWPVAAHAHAKPWPAPPPPACKMMARPSEQMVKTVTAVPPQSVRMPDGSFKRVPCPPTPTAGQKGAEQCNACVSIRRSCTKVIRGRAHGGREICLTKENAVHDKSSSTSLEDGDGEIARRNRWRRVHQCCGICVCVCHGQHADMRE